MDYSVEYYNYNSTRISDQINPPVTVRFSGWHNCLPGHLYGPAKRDHYILHYVCKGRGFYRARGKTYALGPGDGFLIYPYESTCYQADTADPWSYRWIAWTGDYAQEILTHFTFTEDNLIFHKEEIDAVLPLFEAVYKIYESDYNPYSLLGGFYSLMACFIDSANRDDLVLNRAITFIHNNFRSIQSINEIADCVFMSRSHLYRLFMDAFGKSPKKYLEDIRLDKAQRLLESTEQSIHEIARDCGYGSAAHFSDAFKRSVGLSPTRYRAMRREKLGNLNILL